MEKERAFTLVELVMVLFIVGILSVVAVPRYIDIQKEVQETEALEYVCALRAALAEHVVAHYRHGVPWVKDGEALMKLVRDPAAMPEGMTYENDTWIAHGAGRAWRFEGAAGESPPRIVRVREKG